MGLLSNKISSKEFVPLFKSGLPYYMELGIFGLVPEKNSSATATVKLWLKTWGSEEEKKFFMDTELQKRRNRKKNVFIQRYLASLDFLKKTWNILSAVSMIYHAWYIITDCVKPGVKKQMSLAVDCDTFFGNEDVDFMNYINFYSLHKWC